jgi:WD40 repeat protein
MSNYYHVYLAISQFGKDHFRAELFTEDRGSTAGELPPVSWKGVEEWFDFLEQGAADLEPPSAEDLGKRLFAYLLGKKNQANLGKWREVVQYVWSLQKPNEPVVLRLLIDTSIPDEETEEKYDKIHNLPYGLLRDDADNYYLFQTPAANQQRPRIQFVRILRQSTPRPLNLLRQPLRVLLAAAEPRGKEYQMAVATPTGEEGPPGCAALLVQLAGALEGATGPAAQKAFEVSVCAADGVRSAGEVIAVSPVAMASEHFTARFCRTTGPVLESALRDGDFDILHLLAHGSGTHLLLCDGNGDPDKVGSDRLGQWCGANRKLQLGFLQGCRTAQTEGRGGFGGVAQQLLNPRGGNLPAVVASSYPLEAVQSTEAASAFYQALARRQDPDAALPRNLAPPNWSWALLELWVRLGPLGKPEGRPALQYLSPYRGLAQFEERNADIFFGRRKELVELLQVLDSEPVVAVGGDAGSGKSSFLRAGLTFHVRLRGLARQAAWQIVLLRPGYQPAHNLLAALAPGSVDSPAAGPPTDWQLRLDAQLETALRANGPLLLVFDQFEEMFTLCQDNEQRLAVAQALAKAAEQHRDQFRLVLGVRMDYLGAAAALDTATPEIPNLVRRPWVLGPPTIDNIREIITRPAERCGYRFEADLLDRLFKDPLLDPRLAGAEAGPAAPESAVKTTAPLPLLEFALERLWLKAIDRDSDVFTLADYKEIGGLAGAIAKHADEVYLALAKQFGPEAPGVAEYLFTEVSRRNNTRRPRPRRDLAGGTSNPALAQKLIDHLINERLLAVRMGSSETDPDQALVEIAHEVLIERWGLLRTWLSLDPKGREVRRGIQDDTLRWKESSKKPDLLVHRGARLQDAEALAGRPGSFLTEDEKAYVKACAVERDRAEADERNRKRRELEQAQRLAEAKEAERREAEGRLQAEKRELEKANQLAEAKQQALLDAEENARRLGKANEGLRSRAWKLALATFLTVLAGVAAGVFALDANESAEQARANETRALTAMEKERQTSYRQGILLAYREWQGKNVSLADEILDRCKEEQPAWEWRYLKRLCHADELTFTGHAAPVHSVAVSADGQIVASGDAAGIILIWKPAGGQICHTLRGHSGQVDSLAFSRDNRWLASGSEDKTVRLWEVVTGKAIRVFREHKDWVTGAAFSSDGKLLASSSSDHTLRVRDLSTRRVVWEENTINGSFDCLAFRPNHPRQLAGGVAILTPIRWNGSLSIWDVQKNEMILTLPREGYRPFHRLAFFPNGNLLATVDHRSLLHIWDLEKRKAVGTVTNKEGLWSVAVSPDGKRLAVSSTDQTLSVWDVQESRPPHIFRGHTGAVTELSFSPDKRHLVSASLDKTVKIWEAGRDQEALTLREHSAWINAVAFSPHSKRLATASKDRTVKMWDPITGRELRSLSYPDAVLSIAFSPDGKRLAAAVQKRGVTVRDLVRGRESYSIPGEGECVAVSPDNNYLACATRENRIKLYDPRTGTLKRILRGQHTHAIVGLTFSRDSRWLASASQDQTVKIWSLQQGEELRTLRGHGSWVTAVAFNPSGSRVASAARGDHNIRVWDVRSGKALMILGNPGEEFTSVAFTPDGRRLVAGVGPFMRSGEVIMWDAATGNMLLTLRGHTGEVNCVAFSDDGRFLATGSGGLQHRGEVKVWDATPLEQGGGKPPALRMK